MGASCSCVDSVFGDDDEEESINMDSIQPQDGQSYDIEEHCFVYNNTINNINTYTFNFRKSQRIQQPIATIPLDEKTSNDDIKWAMYIKLNNIQQNKYTESIKPNGYWHIFSTDSAEKQYKKQTLNQSDLEMICQTLHNFHALYNYDNSYQIILNLNNNKYKLIYWNQTDLNKPNTFCILNQTDYEKQISQNVNIKQEEFETYYMRFEYNPIQQQLQWEWYDSNTNDFVQWEYKNNKYLYCQLEASYLSNVFESFDPKKIAFKFDVCLLTNAECVYTQNVKSDTDNDDIKYLFTVDQVTDSDEIRIKNMKCICYNSVNKQLFKFDVRKCINGKDCLVRQAEDKICKEINSKWKWNGSIENISECSVDQVKYITWNYVLPTMNNAILNGIKFELIEYFTKNEFTGGKIKKMKAKKFVFSIRAALSIKKAKSLMELYQCLMNFDFSCLEITN